MKEKKYKKKGKREGKSYRENRPYFSNQAQAPGGHALNTV